LEVDELPVLGVLRIAEVVGGEEHAFQELFGNSSETHKYLIKINTKVKIIRMMDFTPA
jgi:hypothetical protein